MDADFAVELGADDEALEFPWVDPEGRLRYYDLKRHPELIRELEEVHRVPELGEFLAALNSASSAFESAKCDAWLSSEMSVEGEIFGTELKFGCYVDILFIDEASRFSFSAHEEFVRRITKLLRVSPDVPASTQFLIRRCFYRDGAETRGGFYVTFYLFGYGQDERAAREQWGIGLKVVETAVGQICEKVSSRPW